MTFMKNNYVKVLTVALIAFLCIGLSVYIVIINNRRQALKSIIALPSSYAFVFDEEQKFTLDFYISDQEGMILQPEAIVNASIIDEAGTIEFQVTINKLIIERDYLTIEQTKYYPAQLVIQLPFASDEMILIDEAILSLTIGDGTKLALPLGSIAFYHQQSRHAFIVNQLTGLISSKTQSSGLAGVVMQLTSLEDEEVKITNIELINASCQVQYDYAQVLNQLPNIRNLTEILGQELSLNTRPIKKAFQVQFAALETINILLPFCYLNQYFTEQAGFIITYEYMGHTYRQIIEPRRLMQSLAGNFPGVKIVYDPN